jgi:hypothetical protein
VGAVRQTERGGKGVTVWASPAEGQNAKAKAAPHDSVRKEIVMKASSELNRTGLDSARQARAAGRALARSYAAAGGVATIESDAAAMRNHDAAIAQGVGRRSLAWGMHTCQPSFELG